MKLKQITEADKRERGTYAGVKYCSTTEKNIERYLTNNHLPNPISREDIHTTLLYSRKYLPNYHPQELFEPPILALFKCFTIWKTTEEQQTKNCLVALIESPELVQLHKKYMKEHSATYDYQQYVPHITLSYDVGEIDITHLKPFDFPLFIIKEYKEDLDLNWER